MAKKSMIAKAKREPKFSTRQHNRCSRCGRPRAYYRKFGLCRICVRELASKGELPARDQVFVVNELTRHAFGCAGVTGGGVMGANEPDAQAHHGPKEKDNHEHDRSHRRYAYARA